MSVDENQRTTRNSVSENSSVMENLHNLSLGGEVTTASGGSSLRSRTHSESETTDSGQQGRRQTGQTGQGGKQTPSNLNTEGTLTQLNSNARTV